MSQPTGSGAAGRSGNARGRARGRGRVGRAGAGRSQGGRNQSLSRNGFNLASIIAPEENEALPPYKKARLALAQELLREQAETVRVLKSIENKTAMSVPAQAADEKVKISSTQRKFLTSKVHHHLINISMYPKGPDLIPYAAACINKSQESMLSDHSDFLGAAITKMKAIIRSSLRRDKSKATKSAVAAELTATADQEASGEDMPINPNGALNQEIATSWLKDEFYRRGYGEESEQGDEEGLVYDDYGNEAFSRMLWRAFPFNTHDAVYTEEEQEKLDLDVGHPDVPVRHLTPAMIAWVDLLAWNRLEGRVDLGSKDEEVHKQHQVYLQARGIAERTTSAYVVPLKPSEPQEEGSAANGPHQQSN